MSRYVMVVRERPAISTSVDTDITFLPDATVRIIRGNLTMDVPVSTVEVGDVYMLGQGLKLVDVISVTLED